MRTVSYDHWFMWVRENGSYLDGFKQGVDYGFKTINDICVSIMLNKWLKNDLFNAL